MKTKVGLVLVALSGCLRESPKTHDSIPVPPKDSIRKPTSSQADINGENAYFDAEIARTAISEWHAQHEPNAPLKSLEVFPVPDHPNLVLAICDTEPGWCGYFGLFELQQSRVVSRIIYDRELDEQSVRWLRGLRLPGFPSPMIEVFGMTHMGNGRMYLFELHDQKLRLLLMTRAVDFHEDRETFRNGRLIPDYVDLNSDGVSDIVLRGEIQESTENGDAIVSTRTCQKVFFWNAESHKFVEDHSQRMGFKNEND